MTVRKRYAIPVVLLLAAIAAWCWLTRTEPPIPDELLAKAGQVRTGMTPGEVSAILGPGEELEYSAAHPKTTGRTGWFGRESMVDIWFRYGVVSSVIVSPNPRPQPPAPTWLDRVRKRLGL